jgi:hypothetical protein
VESAQKAVDQAVTASRSDLAAAGTACGSSSSHSGAAPPSAAPTDPAACLAAETTALSSENDLAGKQSALSQAQTTLSKVLTTASTATTTAATTATSATPVSAAQLAQYQAALDADTAAVAVAEQNLGQGTAISPLTGTVVSVSMAVGQSVTGASSAALIAISAPDGYQITATVPTAQIARVQVGQHASVTPDGGNAALPAAVTAVAATPGTSGYQVTLGLSASGSSLREGSAAAVRLTTGSAAAATVVPTSAVHTIGSRSLVDVLADGTATPTVVTVGIVGSARTQVLSGLRVGQQVVLADLSSTVTSDSSTSTTTGRGGGLTGGGLSGGGLTGGGLTGGGLGAGRGAGGGGAARPGG